MILNRRKDALLNILRFVTHDDNVYAIYSNILVRKLTKFDIFELQ